MYGVLDRRTFPQSTVSFIATIGCLGLALLLVAATVVLALIPIYTSNKSVSTNPDVLRSKEIVMALEIDAGDSSTTGRRRRRRSDGLSDIAGGSCDDDGKKKVKDKLFGKFKSHKKVRDIDISKIEFGYEPAGLQSPNITYTTSPIVMVIHFYILYESTCFYSCQVDMNPIIRSELSVMSLDAFIFTEIAIYKNNIFYKFISTIRCTRVAYISVILAGLSLEIISNPFIILIYPSVTEATTGLPSSTMMMG